MATYPVFSVGEVLTADDMNAVGLWKITNCTVTSVGGTAATASNGVITIGAGNTSVTVSSAFSSDYDNYRIIFSNMTSNVTSSIQVQLSASTGTTYQMYGYYGAFGSAAINGYGPAATAQWNDVLTTNTVQAGGELVLFHPQKATATVGFSYGVSTSDVYHFACRDTSTAQSTGFKLTLPGTNTLQSGTVRVYGFRN